MYTPMPISAASPMDIDANVAGKMVFGYVNSDTCTMVHDECAGACWMTNDF